MSILFTILIVITCAVLAFFVLIQNPKGGGLAGSFGGLGNQMMGAKQSTDVVEKGTWVSAAILLVLTLGSFIMTPKTSNSANEKTRSEKLLKGIQTPAAAPQQAPAQGQQQAAPQQGGDAGAQQQAPAQGQPQQAPAPQK